MSINLKEHFDGKRVLVTGHTGFKGSWLSFWLRSLGAQVAGYSLNVPTTPSIFEESNLSNKIDHRFGDVRDSGSLANLLKDMQPDFVFHLAAQPLVREAYNAPLDTITTNAIGTATVLESLKECRHSCAAVFVTSDKVYDNQEWYWGYRETDRLGGKDPYSASKAMAELAFRTYYYSFFRDHPVRIASGRAGNVIGGGDWARDRIVPDAIRAWSTERELVIRFPNATRPWQHVLEPLSGYLHLAAMLSENPSLNGESFNFGPSADQNFSVEQLLREMQTHWPTAGWQVAGGSEKAHEAGLLKLNCDKAFHMLGWKPTLTFQETCSMTVEWYRSFYADPTRTEGLVLADLNQYYHLAVQRQSGWK